MDLVKGEFGIGFALLKRVRNPEGSVSGRPETAAGDCCPTENQMDAFRRVGDFADQYGWK
jgi:hypothetical protein